MSVRITTATEVALYDSVTGIAFGETFQSAEDAEAFLAWLPSFEDPRTMSVVALAGLRLEWEKARSHA